MDVLSALYGDDMLVESTPATMLLINLRIEGIAVGHLQVTLIDTGESTLLDVEALQVRSVAGTRASDAMLRHRLVEAASMRSSDGEEFSATICALVELAQDLLQRAPCIPEEGPPKAPNACVTLIRHCLLHIDHMRSRRSYTRLICDWAAELGLSGALLISSDAAPLILLYLHGSDEALREYKRRHRTTPVDVDSTGRKCKEKMMSELYDSDMPAAAAVGSRLSGTASTLATGGARSAEAEGVVADDSSFVVAEGWPASRTAQYLLQRGIPPSVLAGIPQLRDAATAATAVAAAAGGAGAGKP